MVNLFVLFFLISIVLLIASLIKPSIFNRIFRRDFARKRGVGIFGSLIVVFFILIGIFAPPADKTKVLSETESNKLIPTVAVGINDTPTPLHTAEIHSTPIPTITSIPSPTEKPLPTKTIDPTRKPTVYIQPTNKIYPIAQPQTQTSSGTCDPSYPSVCIAPYPPDLDCSQVPYDNFKVLEPDPHRFDREGDGIGCES